MTPSSSSIVFLVSMTSSTTPGGASSTSLTWPKTRGSLSLMFSFAGMGFVPRMRVRSSLPAAACVARNSSSACSLVV